MDLSRFKAILAWTCLIAFGLNCTVFAGGVVICHDHRGSHLEIGCKRDEQGGCLSSGCEDGLDDDSSDYPTQPCSDTPLVGNHFAPKVASCPNLLTAPAFLYDIAIVQAPDLFVPTLVRARMLTARGRPPDSVNRLRTVVLLV